MSNQQQVREGLTKAWDTYRHGPLCTALPNIDAPRGRRIAVELH
jgi:hypothetical protein